MITRQTVFRRIIPACVLAAVLIFNVLLVLVLVNYQEDRADVRDAEHFVTLGELYNQPENVQELYDMLAGAENTSYQDIYTMAEGVASTYKIRKKTYHKNANQNMIVTFGGLEWQVCYLSLTGDENDAKRTPILTLLLAEAKTISKYQTWATNGVNVPYPCNMYGTSYIRAVTLNNGGQYATDEYTLKSVNQDRRNQFAIFTMDEVSGSVTDAIIKPREVKWQETQSAVASEIAENNFNNDAWGVPSSNSSFAESIDYTALAGNDAWKNDYLWLPSYTEIGEEIDDVNHKGIWQLLNRQRKYGYTYWLRSVPQSSFYGGYALQVNKKGNVGLQPVHDGGYYVLPALHLNLDAASMRASSTIAGA